MPECSQPKPNFFIVGAAQSGTTSLWMYLKQHPDVFMPETIDLKELAYFCYLNGIKDYNKHLSIFEKSHGMKAVGEASHAYLTSPESATWIKDFNPLAKIIIILRNPIERAHSLYNWMISEGYEWIYPFEKALRMEQKRLEDERFKHCNLEYWYNYLYFNSGLYSKQFQRYINVFPKKQVYVLLLEDLKENPISTIQQLYSFLEVDSSFTPNDLNVYNAKKVPKSVKLQFFAKQRLHKYLLKLRVPCTNKIQNAILKINCVDSNSRIRHLNIDSATAEKLQDNYREDIDKTSKIINRDLRSWHS